MLSGCGRLQIHPGICHIFVKYIGPRINASSDLKEKGLSMAGRQLFKERSKLSNTHTHNANVPTHSVRHPYILNQSHLKIFVFLFAYCACVCEMSTFIQYDIFSILETLLLRRPHPECKGLSCLYQYM